LRSSDPTSSKPDVDARNWWNPVDTVFASSWLEFGFYALALGALGFLNTWDMPVYLGLVTLAYGGGVTLQLGEFRWAIVRQALALAIGLLFTSIGIYILFFTSFRSQAGGILPYVFPPTRLPQFLVMFGPFVIILLFFLIALALQNHRQNPGGGMLKASLRTWLAVAGICAAFFALLLVAILASSFGRQMLASGQVDPLLQPILGNLTLNETLRSILLARLTNPWLFILITGLIGLIFANLAYWIRHEDRNVLPPTSQPVQQLTEAFVLVMYSPGWL